MCLLFVAQLDGIVRTCYFCIVAFQLPTGQHDDRLYLYSVLVLAGLAQPILSFKKFGSLSLLLMPTFILFRRMLISVHTYERGVQF
jgi:hypothetical protein